jgi:hypothetical protein
MQLLSKRPQHLPDGAHIAALGLRPHALLEQLARALQIPRAVLQHAPGLRARSMQPRVSMLHRGSLTT